MIRIHMHINAYQCVSMRINAYQCVSMHMHTYQLDNQTVRLSLEFECNLNIIPQMCNQLRQTVKAP